MSGFRSGRRALRRRRRWSSFGSEPTTTVMFAPGELVGGEGSENDRRVVAHRGFGVGAGRCECGVVGTDGETEDCGEQDGLSTGEVAGVGGQVGVDRCHDRGGGLGATGEHPGGRWFPGHDAVDPLVVVGRHGQGDDTARAEADDGGGRNVKVLEERGGVGGVLPRRHRQASPHARSARCLAGRR